MVRLRNFLRRLNIRKLRMVLGVFISAFVLINVFLAVIYNSKTYPKAHLANNSIGSVPYADIEQYIRETSHLPSQIKLKVADKTQIIETEKIGVSIDTDQTVVNIKNQRSWLPIWNLLAYSNAPLHLQAHDETFTAFAATYAQTQSEQAVNATFEQKDGVIQIKNDRDGFSLQPEQIKQAVMQALQTGQAVIEIIPQTTKAKITTSDLKPQLEILQQQIKTAVTLTFKNKTKTFSEAEVASWYELAGGKATLDDTHIQASVAATGRSFGILVANTADIVSGVKQTLTNKKPATFALKEAPKPTRQFTYCVAARGVSTSYLSTFSAKLASVYANARGWGLGGQITFSKVSAGCDFTAWLSAASQMSTFGAICDSNWSCRVGPNVVINFDRWQNASPAWNQNGGSLDDYRSMVINHETGHWFGYYHAYCGGTGQLAPVMQQQSINLQGCKFNPWPTTGELASHRRTLGL